MVGLELDAGDGLDSVEKILTFGGLFDIGVDEQRVRLRVDVFHHDLEAVEAASFSSLHLVRETLDKILSYNAVRGGEECEDVTV